MLLSLVSIVAVVVGVPLAMCLPWAWTGIMNDYEMIKRDPALGSPLEALFAYPGFWALAFYRVCHCLWGIEQLPYFVSHLIPRLVMSGIRYVTSVDIHPAASISEKGVLFDHAAGIVIGADAVIGAQVTMYHQVTLGQSGKPLPKGQKRHPTVGDRVMVGAGAKILGDITVGNDCLVGANSVVTKSVPANHTVAGIPARVFCKGSSPYKDVTGHAICELHLRLAKVESTAATPGETAATAAAVGKKEEQQQAVPPAAQDAAAVAGSETVEEQQPPRSGPWGSRPLPASPAHTPSERAETVARGVEGAAAAGAAAAVKQQQQQQQQRRQQEQPQAAAQGGKAKAAAAAAAAAYGGVAPGGEAASGWAAATATAVQELAYSLGVLREVPVAAAKAGGGMRWPAGVRAAAAS